MISGIILGLLTFYGFYLLFSRLPLVAQKFFKKHKLLSDGLITVGGYFLLSNISSSVVSAVGSAVNGILASFFIGGRTPIISKIVGVLKKESPNNDGNE